MQNSDHETAPKVADNSSLDWNELYETIWQAISSKVLPRRYSVEISGDHKQLLQSLVSQAAFSIQNLEALLKARAQLDALRIVDKAVLDVIEHPKLEDVLKLALERSMELTQSPYGTISWYDEQTHDLTIRAEKISGNSLIGARQRLGQGIVGKAAQQRKSIIVNDLKSSEWSETYISLVGGMRSELAVPLLDDDRILGVLNVEHPDPFAYSEDDRIWMELLVERIILTQKLTILEAERRVADLNVLREISKIIVITFDEVQILNLILDKALELTGAQIGSIRLLKAEQLEVMVSRVPEGVLVDDTWNRIPIGDGKKGITSWVANNRQSVIVKDTKQEPRYIAYFQGMRSEVTVPLLKDSEVVGVLSLESPQITRFDENDERVLSILAFLAVMAIQNAERYRELRQINEALQREQEQRVAAERMVMIANLAANLAHRMGNDSGIILARAKELKRRLPTPFPHFGYFDNSLDKIIETATKLSTWSDRLREPVQPEKLEVFDVHQLLDNAIREVTLADSKIHVNKNYSPYAMKVKSSINQLTETLRVVIHNAVDAMEGEGILTVNTRLADDKSGEWVEILISDTGKGIRLEDQDSIFRLFYTTKRGKGMGYGLWWARTFLMQSNGDIKLIHSELNKGSTFQILLPYMSM